VWKLDRLGRSLRDLITMLDELRERGIRFQSLTEAIDTDTPTGRAMWQMIGVLAELERSLKTERTRAGREIRAEAEAHRRADRACTEADRRKRNLPVCRKPPERGPGNALPGSCRLTKRRVEGPVARLVKEFGRIDHFHA
jgi:hypothetical protein